MDFRTRLLLGATALAVIGYFALIYGGCALDTHCHLRSCRGRYICGVVHDPDTLRRASAKGWFRVPRHGTEISLWL